MKIQTEPGKLSMPLYACHKVVKALEIRVIEPHVPDPSGSQGTGASGAIIHFVDGQALWVDNGFMQKHKPQHAGYFVMYDDGYCSWSPALAFVKGYELSAETQSPEKPLDNPTPKKHRRRG